jgi:glutamate synthase (NADPH/NADH) large chain
MEQVFLACPDHIVNPDDFERRLFVLRNYASHTINNTTKKDPIGFYIASLSYKNRGVQRAAHQQTGAPLFSRPG